MAANVEHYFTPRHDPNVQRRSPAAGGGQALPMGTDTGDLLVWNATAGAWEVLAKPAGWAMLIAGADGVPYWLPSPDWPGLLGYLAVDGDTGEIYWRT
jgi:hypothetical protein